MHDPNLLPVPYVLIDEHFAVHDLSREAQQLFGTLAHLPDIVDAASRTKLLEVIHPLHTLSPVELNLITRRGDLQLFDVYQCWSPEDSLGRLVCIPKDPQIEAVARQLHSIRELAARPLSPPAVPAAPAADVGRGKSLSKLRYHLATIRDIIHVLRPSLVELGRGPYTDLLTDELDAAEQLLQDDKKGTS